MPKCDWFFALLCPQSLSKENLGKTFSLTLARNKSWNKKKILNASCCWHDATAYRIFSKSSSSASPVVWNLCKSPVWFCSNLLSKFHPPFSFFSKCVRRSFPSRCLLGLAYGAAPENWNCEPISHFNPRASNVNYCEKGKARFSSLHACHVPIIN